MLFSCAAGYNNRSANANTDAKQLTKLPPVPAYSPFNLAVGLVLAERVDGPDRGGNPADHGDLQDQAGDAGKRAAYREKREPWQNKGDQQAHR